MSNPVLSLIVPVYNEAKQLEQLVRYFYDTPCPIVGLGKIYFDRKDYNQAEQAYLNALARASDENKKKIHRYLSFTYLRMRRQDQAIEHARLADGH